MTRPLSDDLRRCRIRPCVSGICSKGGCPGPRPEAVSSESRPEWREPSQACFPAAGLAPPRPVGSALCGPHTASRVGNPPRRRALALWRNPNTINAGAVTPTPTYGSPSGTHCREYQLTATAGRRTGQAHGSAWRVPARGQPPLSRPQAGCTRHDPEDAQRLILPA